MLENLLRWSPTHRQSTFECAKWMQPYLYSSKLRSFLLTELSTNIMRRAINDLLSSRIPTCRWLDLKVLQGTWIDELFTMSFCKTTWNQKIYPLNVDTTHLDTATGRRMHTHPQSKSEWMQEDFRIQIRQLVGLFYTWKSSNFINYSTLNSEDYCEHYWEDLFIQLGINKHALPTTETMKVRFSVWFLLMVHCEYANTTQVLLCKSNRLRWRTWKTNQITPTYVRSGSPRQTFTR